jgi:phytoene synthase
MSSPLTAELTPEKRLALTYAPARASAATLAMFALDERLARILRRGGELLAGQLRLAWWRETLRQPAAEWPRGDPLLDMLGGWREPAMLADLADGWEGLLAEQVTEKELAEFAEGRASAFACLANELGMPEPDKAAAAARVWALADLTAHLSQPREKALALAYASTLPAPPRLPGELRPLAVLAALGAAALRGGGGPLLAGPGSALRALRTGLTGR